MIIRQELSQQDKVNRLRFARTINREINNGTLDLQEVMWSDEAAFLLNGQEKPGIPDIMQKGVTDEQTSSRKGDRTKQRSNAGLLYEMGINLKYSFSMKTSMHRTTKL